MTLIELQNVLGSQITKLLSSDMQDDSHRQLIEDSKTIVGLAKQMINNADVILRSKKLLITTNTIDDTISKMISNE